jgi:hypothetical protein
MFVPKTIGEFCAEYEPLSYAIEPIIRSSSVYTLTARTGAGKTAFLVIAALSIATGRTDLLGFSVTKGRVAYCAFENPDDVRMRFKVAAFSFSINLEDLGNDILIIDVRKKPEEIVAILDAATIGEGFALTIVDTLQAAFDGDDFNNNAQAGEFIRRLRKLTVELAGHPAVVIAAHPTKNATEDQLVPYGGGAILNEVDGNLTLWKSAEEIVALHHGKLRGLDFQPVAYRFERTINPDMLDAKGQPVALPVLKPVTPAEFEAQARAGTSLKIRLLRVMASNPDGTQRQWRQALGCAVATVNKHLHSLKAEGLTEKKLGKWCLTKKGRIEAEAHKPETSLTSPFPL